jgi:hypothetical protein
VKLMLLTAVTPAKDFTRFLTSIAGEESGMEWAKGRPIRAGVVQAKRNF